MLVKNLLFALGASALLAGCGDGADPTPPPEEAAPAAAINATVEKAEAQQERAEDIAKAQGAGE